MSWSAITVPFILAALIFLVPGSLLALASGRRGVEVLLIAPVLSVGLIGGGAVMLGALGIPFNLLGVLAVTLVSSLIFGMLTTGMRRHRDRKGRVERADDAVIARSAPTIREEFLAVLCGLIVNLLVLGWTYASALSGPDVIFQNYDVPFHYSVITFLVETRNGSSFHAALVDRTIGSSFYPAGWHDTVALIITTTHVWLPVAVTASILAMLFLALPLSAMALTRRLLPGRPMALFAAASCCGIFGAFPVRFLVWGILYSNALSWCLLPAAIGILVGIFQDRDQTACTLLFFLALTGVAMAQPNGVFTGLVLCTPLFMSYIQRVGQRFSKPRLVGITFNMIFLAVLIVGWTALHGTRFMHRTVIADWPAHTTIVGAIKEAFTNSTNGMPPQYVLSAAVLAAVIVWFVEARTRGDRALWPLAGLGISLFIYVVGSGIGSVNVDGAGFLNVFRDVLTGFWYHDQMRLAAIPLLMCVPLLGGLFDSIARLLTRIQKKKFLSVALAVVCVLTLVLISVHSGEIATRRQGIRQLSTLNDDWPLTDDELAFMRRVHDYLPEGTTVLNNPYDGSAYGYSLVGLNVYFRSYDSNWIGIPTQDQEELRHHIDELKGRADELCPVLERNKINYVLVMNMNSVTAGPDGFLIYPPGNWTGLTGITTETPGFEEVLTDSNGAHLYRITGCDA